MCRRLVLSGSVCGHGNGHQSRRGDSYHDAAAKQPTGGSAPHAMVWSLRRHPRQRAWRHDVNADAPQVDAPHGPVEATTAYQAATKQFSMPIAHRTAMQAEYVRSEAAK